MAIQLRPYQARVIDDAREAIRRVRERLRAKGIERGPRVLIQCPTGAGKTVLASFITRSHLDASPQGRVAFIAHRDFLIDQTSKTFASVGIEHSFVAQKRWYNPYARAHVCMVNTAKNRIAKLAPPTLCITDEAHHAPAGTWAKVIDAWSSATHIGLSATPVRLDGKGLDAYFDDMVLGPSVAELIELGALSDYTYYAPTAPDLSAVKIRMGDYEAKGLDAEMGKAVVIGNLVQHYGKHARGKKAVYFCTSVKNSIETAQAFNAKGFRFQHLDGSHSPWERQQAARMLAMGELDGLTNVGLFGEGFDLAAQAGMDVTVEVVGLARPTKSLGLSRQMVGRVLRAKSYPGIILDHAGHLQEHGLPDDDVQWSLSGVEKKDAAKTYQCQGCGAASRVFAPVCPHCGHVQERERGPAGDGRQVEFVEGELEQVDKDAIKRERLREQSQARSLDELIELGRRRGYRDAQKWAAHVYTARAAKSRMSAGAARG